jgi:hypothetical protein
MPTSLAFSRLLRSALVAALFLTFSPANAKPPRCQRSWTADQEAATATLLQSRFGDPYKLYDLHHPGMVLMFGIDTMQTPEGQRRVPKRNISWSSFAPAEGAPANTPGIIVAYDPCSGKALGYRIIPAQGDDVARPQD